MRKASSMCETDKCIRSREQSVLLGLLAGETDAINAARQSSVTSRYNVCCMKVYLDNNIVSALAKKLHGQDVWVPAEMAALAKIRQYSAAGKIQLVTSQKTQHEIEKLKAFSQAD